MELSQFAGDDFEAKGWINHCFQNGAGESSHPKTSHLTPSEQLAGSLIMKLQLSIQELSMSLEDSCQQMLQNVPRIVCELDTVQQESKILQDQMKLVKEDIQKVEQDTAVSMQQLLALDCVKGRVLEASSALKEADNWATLASDVDVVFESGDILAMRSKIVGMQQSLDILRDVPDFKERKSLLETLKDRLEALMSPLVVAALTAESVETVQAHVQVFKDIKRINNIAKRYQECHKIKLLQQWEEFCNMSSLTCEQNRTDPPTTPSDPAIDRLPFLFDDILLPFWFTQLKWCGIVFGPAEAPDIIAQVVISVLHDLVPSISSVLSLIVKQNNDKNEPISALIQARRVSEGFCNRLIADLPPCSPLFPTLLRATFEPYFSHVASFGDHLQKYLLQQLEGIPLSHTDDVDAGCLLSDSIGKVVVLADQGFQFCIELTGGLELPALRDSIIAMLKEYIKDLKRVLTNLQARQVARVNSDSVLDLEWEQFQQALRIVHIMGDLILAVEDLDGRLLALVSSQLSSLHLNLEPKFQPSQTDLLILALRLSWVTSNKKNPSTIGPLSLLELCDVLTETSSFLGECVLDSLRSLARAASDIAFDFLFQPLKCYLSAKIRLEGEESVSGELLPSYAESEYITEVGQYLMTVPQQLEPFVISSEDAGMKTAVKWSNLQSTPLSITTKPITQSLADFDLVSFWLDVISRAFTSFYIETILNIPSLSERATKQLVLDLEYLHVVFEDLGVVTAKEEVGLLLQLLKEEGCAEKMMFKGNEIGAKEEIVRKLTALRQC